MLWLVDGSEGESQVRRSWINWFPVSNLSVRKRNSVVRKSRTLNLDHLATYHLYSVAHALHFVAHVLHFVAHILYFAVDYFEFISDAVCDPQVLHNRHPSLLLRQSI